MPKQASEMPKWNHYYLYENVDESLKEQLLQIAKEDNIKSLQLAVRETQDAAIKLFTGKNYTKWGENPYYAYINGSFIKGYYYYKNL